MSKLSTFPHITPAEFSTACSALQTRFEKHSHVQNKWLAAEALAHATTYMYMNITKLLPHAGLEAPNTGIGKSEDTEVEEDGDVNALVTVDSAQPTVEYDIILSPSYQVPVLYINIRDRSHRFPTTMDVLYKYIIPPEFKAQAEKAGVIGGITITDHPLTNKPVFFIHPCQTAAVMQASITGKENGISPFEYLVMWIGAFGGCVGLEVPAEIIADGNVLSRGP